jgi:hypothetical protein
VASRRLWVICLLVACIVAPVAYAGLAVRSPTLKERAAITAALPQWLRAYPVGCVWLDVSVSSMNARFAKVAPQFLNATRQPCGRYASNGFWILRRATKWRIVFNGSVWPPCSLRIPRDLTRCSP